MGCDFESQFPINTLPIFSSISFFLWLASAKPPPESHRLFLWPQTVFGNDFQTSQPTRSRPLFLRARVIGKPINKYALRLKPSEATKQIARSMVSIWPKRAKGKCLYKQSRGAGLSRDDGNKMPNRRLKYVKTTWHLALPSPDPLL